MKAISMSMGAPGISLFSLVTFPGRSILGQLFGRSLHCSGDSAIANYGENIGGRGVDVDAAKRKLAAAEPHHFAGTCLG